MENLNPPEAARARPVGNYLASDTIAAVSSAVGGAISIVRVSGPSVRLVLGRLAPRATATPRKLERARLEGPSGKALDDALVVFFANPESFTGEDMLELHLHGGAFTAHSVMENLSQLGARQALPGEFSFRAVRNGKLSLSQAEAVADLIQASNEGAVSLALEKLSGAQNAILEEFAQELRSLAALAEAGIDFSDQDLDEVSLPSLRKRLGAIRERLHSLSGSYERGMRIQDGIGVAFVGLPNAGKSSFFNSLLGEDRSIVSEMAGTTRDVIREKLTLRGRHASVTLRLEDTAGLRVADNAVEQEGVARSHQSAASADIILLVVDPGHSLDALAEVWKELTAPLDRVFAIITKTDVALPEQIRAARRKLAAWGISKILEVSSVSGAGISSAAIEIAAFCETLAARQSGEILLTRLNQVTAAKAALADLERAAKAPEIELFAADLKQALHSLSPLIGQTLPDDILGKIFSEFCIGK